MWWHWRDHARRSLGYDLLNSDWCAEYGNSYTVRARVVIVGPLSDVVPARQVWVDHHDTWDTTTAIFPFLASHPSCARASGVTHERALPPVRAVMLGARPKLGPTQIS